MTSPPITFESIVQPSSMRLPIGFCSGKKRATAASLNRTFMGPSARSLSSNSLPRTSGMPSASKYPGVVMRTPIDFS
jgi:hypothetical protein